MKSKRRRKNSPSQVTCPLFQDAYTYKTFLFSFHLSSLNFQLASRILHYWTCLINSMNFRQCDISIWVEAERDFNIYLVQSGQQQVDMWKIVAVCFKKNDARNWWQLFVWHKTTPQIKKIYKQRRLLSFFPFYKSMKEVGTCSCLNKKLEKRWRVMLHAIFFQLIPHIILYFFVNELCCASD